MLVTMLSFVFPVVMILAMVADFRTLEIPDRLSLALAAAYPLAALSAGSSRQTILWSFALGGSDAAGGDSNVRVADNGRRRRQTVDSDGTVDWPRTTRGISVINHLGWRYPDDSSVAVSPPTPGFPTHRHRSLAATT